MIKGVKIEKEKIMYKYLTPEHKEEVRKLHEEWFPIKYDDQFYDQCLSGMKNGYFSLAAFYNIETEKKEKKEVILGLIIGQWQYTEKYLYNHVGKDVEKDINDSLDFEDEAKLFLSNRPYHDCILILSLGIIDECRKMGIGSILLKSTLNYGINTPSCVGLFLTVIKDNISGRKFYEKNGLKCVNILNNFYVIDEKKYDCHVYLKIFSKNERNMVRQHFNSMIPFKQRCLNIYIFRPFYFIVNLLVKFFRWLKELSEKFKKDKNQNKVDNKIEDKIANKVEEKVDNKVEDKVENKVDNKNEKK